MTPMHRYEQDLGSLYLTRAPAFLDEDEVALALAASFPDLSPGRMIHALACRHYVMSGDARRIGFYLAAADVEPGGDFDPGLVAFARREVERMRMLRWEMTGQHTDELDALAAEARAARSRTAPGDAAPDRG
ncbi:hypothetical protein ACGFMO_37320 [Streptomyces niveus]|uniref:hypothetical protein n=1 Tax=Streptomyces niveus TaxID=193462 RepID=UPI00371331F4